MVTKEEAKEEISKLIAQYQQDMVGGKLVGSRLNEENTKSWIDDLFRALGWDIRVDVTKEESAGRQKRIDYAFRIDESIQFLLEAKGLDVNLDEHIKQALNYGYLRDVTWVILTNFKEIRVYNSKYLDKQEQIRRLFTPIKIEEFLTRFEDLWLLSKPAFIEGLIFNEAVKYGKITAKEPVTKLISNDLVHWRSLLTSTINAYSKENGLPTDPEEASNLIDQYVQKILDRILFIRVAEDRKVEKEYRLSTLINSWDHQKPLMPQLKTLFREMDKTYNSGLFHPNSSEDLKLNDGVIESIIKETYENKDKIPYDFKIIPADVLGSIYEQYLEHILKKTSKRIKLTESKAKRKAEGIYYTPTDIVDYIVKNTVGEVLQNKKLKDVEKIKILDPACGSGSFLLKAFDTIDIYYRKRDKQYNQNKLDTISDFSTKTKIMQDNIYGVDLDKKAVEIAQLNLLLKIAETRERLPELNKNIRNGNSVIDDIKIAGEKAFKWDEEFKSIIDGNGFDIVIGNPPYVSFGLGRTGKLSSIDQKYFYSEFLNSAEYKISTYALFIELAIRLTKQNGYVGLIIPDSFLVGRYFSKIRKYILESCLIKKIVLFENDFWESGDVGFPVIIILAKNNNSKLRGNNKVEIISCPMPEDLARKQYISISSDQSIFEKSFRNRFRLVFDKKNAKILEKIDNESVPLEEYVDFHHGIRSKIGRDKIISNKNEGKNWVKGLIHSNEINRFSLNYEGNFILIDKNLLFSGGWDKSLIEQEKILIRRTGDKLIATIDNSGLYHTNALIYGVKKGQCDLRTILALLNSDLVNFYYRQTTMKAGRLFPQVEIDTINQLPIKQSKQSDQLIIPLVDKLLSLNKRLIQFEGKNTDESDRVSQEIEAVQDQINNFVYKLYGVTSEEQRIIKESLS